MGLTVQNLGVEAPRVLGVAPEKRDDPVELPPMPGWTWLTLRGVPDDIALDEEAGTAAAAAGARALAYSVEDSDSAYLVGATPAGRAFGLYVNAGVPAREVERAAAFASVPAAAIAAALAPDYVFAEAGVRALLAAMGLTAPLDEAPETMPPDDGDDEEDEDDAAFEAALRGGGRRWAARAQLPFAGRWVAVAAEAQTAGGLVAAFCARRDRMAIVGDSPDIDDLRRRLTQPETGIELGPWHEIPPDVPRSVTATVGWALDTLR